MALFVVEKDMTAVERIVYNGVILDRSGVGRNV